MANVHYFLTKKDYEEAISVLRGETKKKLDFFIGNIGYEDYVIDLTVKNYDDVISLDYDVYLMGEDTGYATTEGGVPYSHKDGGSLMTSTNFQDITYNEFKVKAEKEILDYIAGLN